MSWDVQEWQKCDWSSFAGLNFMLVQMPESEGYMCSFEISMLLFLNVSNKTGSYRM